MINNSNMLHGVSEDKLKEYKLAVVNGCLGLIGINDGKDINRRLPKTTEIEKNYFDAANKIGVSAYTAVGLCVAKLASPDGENWYKYMHGFGANLNPLRWGEPWDVLAKLSTEKAVAQLGATTAFAGVRIVLDELVGAKELNAGEDAWLKAHRAGRPGAAEGAQEGPER